MVDVTPDLNAKTLRQLFELADCLGAITFVDEVGDTFRWNWETSNTYSARSEYLACFEGKIALGGAKQVWESRAPAECKFFLWLALRDCCLTEDRL